MPEASKWAARQQRRSVARAAGGGADGEGAEPDNSRDHDGGSRDVELMAALAAGGPDEIFAALQSIMTLNLTDRSP